MGSTPAVLVTRSRFWAVSTGVIFVVAVLLLSVSPGRAEDLAGLAYIMGTLGFLPACAWLGYHAPRRREITIRVDRRGLSAQRRGRDLGLLRDRASLRRGGAVAMPDGRYRVDLHTRVGPRLRLEVEGQREARELLAALGLDRREGTSRFHLRWHPPVQGFAVVGAVVVGVFALMLVGLGPLWVIGGLVAAGLMPLVDRVLFRVDLTVGIDGLEILRGSGARRFVPHARIVRVEEIGAPQGWPGAEIVSPGFRVVLDDGAILAFDTRDERFRTGVWKTDPIFEGTRDAWTRARASSAQASAVTLLRGDRSTREWVLALREIGSRDAQIGYRVSAIDERTLFDVVTDAQASSELRVAAAVALGAQAEHAPKLRVMADDLAEPMVRRIAIRAATASSDADLEEEIDAVLPSRRAG
ncbi:MAG: hypothetical protein KF819_35310 [Labilithrix sp.]|nr:hypothetical protein [Labilithrix sp.]